MFRVLYPRRAVVWSVVFCVCLSIYSWGQIKIYFIKEDLSLTLERLDYTEKINQQFANRKVRILNVP
ncbi:MAG: hypothetical protein AAB482_00505 [Patescibacteria group bacterium]